MKKIIVSLVSLVLMLGMVGTALGYSFSDTVGTQPVDITVEEIGDSIKWTIDFPMEAPYDPAEGNGKLAVGLIIATDGDGEGPAFQIHNNDGSTLVEPHGTWMYGFWGPTINDGWMGWPNHDLDVSLTGLDWVEATGERNHEDNPDGIFTITIDKSELGGAFHWALNLAIGTGFWDYSYEQMSVPIGITPCFDWGNPLVDMDVPNYIFAPPTYSCVGFEPPVDSGPIKVKKNRVIPFKAELLDEENYPVTDADVILPPVINVMFEAGTPDADDVTDDALSAGFGTDGNQFESRDDKWQFNLKTKNYNAPGTYTVTMVSGDESEYIISPTCTATFIVND